MLNAPATQYESVEIQHGSQVLTIVHNPFTYKHEIIVAFRSAMREEEIRADAVNIGAIYAPLTIILRALKVSCSF